MTRQLKKYRNKLIKGIEKKIQFKKKSINFDISSTWHEKKIILNIYYFLKKQPNPVPDYT